MKTKNWIPVAAAVLIAAAAVEGWQQQSGKRRGETWEYCQVQGWGRALYHEPVPVGAEFRHTALGKASICYNEPSGCRMETVTASYSAVLPKGYISEPYMVGRAQQAAVAAALAKLGAEGWHLVGAGPDSAAVLPSGESSSHPVRSVLYLERRKP